MKDGGPAFPLKGVTYEAGVKTELTTGGMSLRDWFAGQALAGFLSGEQPQSNHYLGNPNGRTLEKWVSEAAYDYADAMLKAREESNG